MTTGNPSASEHGEQIERLLAELQASIGPGVWQRVEALVTALVGLYGAGLERLLAHARDTAESREGLESRIIADELLSSLLLVHDLHPMDLERRIGLALHRLRTDLPTAARLELVGIEDNVVKLRTTSATEGPPPSIQVVSRAIGHEAPEVSGVQIEGLPQSPHSDLIPADRLRRRGRH